WAYGATSCGLRLAAYGCPSDTRFMDERELIYDWNQAGGAALFDWTRARVDLNDETLRDGLQSPSVHDPALDVKKRLLHLMADLGIVAADIGLPGAGPRVVEQVRARATDVRREARPAGDVRDRRHHPGHAGRAQGVVRGGDSLRGDTDLPGGYGRPCDAGRGQGAGEIRQAGDREAARGENRLARAPRSRP